MYQQVLQPMEHTYGDYKMTDETLMQISYLVISKEVARTSKDAPIIIDPFIKIETESLPIHLDYSISFSFIIDNQFLESVVIEIINPKDITVEETDITEMHFSGSSLFDESGNRKSTALVGEIGLVSDNGLLLDNYGVYNIHVKINGKLKAKSFFVVTTKRGVVI